MKKYKRLTIDELRSCKGFENVSDEEANNIVEALEKLSILFYELYHKQKALKQKLTIVKDQTYESEQRIAA